MVLGKCKCVVREGRGGGMAYGELGGVPEVLGCGFEVAGDDL